MPKRSFDEKMEYYLQKMEKMREKHRRKRRRLNSFLSSDEEKTDNVQGKWCIQNHIFAKESYKYCSI